MEDLRNNILIVEQDDGIRSALISLLDEKGYAAQGVAHEWEALSAVRRMVSPAFILLDLPSPETDHRTSKMEARLYPEFASIPVVVMSADRSLRKQAAAMGAVAWIAKPVRFEILGDLVDLLCAGTRQGQSNPLAPVGVVQRTLAPARGGRSAMAGMRVLLVEDEDDVAEVLEEFLRSEGCKVQRASTGLAAIDNLESGGKGWMSTPDVVLMDLGLPDMSGGEVIRRLHAMEWPIPPLIVMSALPSVIVQSEASEMGAAAVLNKPFQIESLLALLSSWARPLFKM